MRDFVGDRHLRLKFGASTYWTVACAVSEGFASSSLSRERG